MINNEGDLFDFFYLCDKMKNNQADKDGGGQL